MINLLLINLGRLQNNNNLNLFVDKLNPEKLVELSQDDNFCEFDSKNYIYEKVDYNSVSNIDLTYTDGESIDAKLLDFLCLQEYKVFNLYDKYKPQEYRYKWYILRRHLYYSHLSYWLKFINHNNISCFVFTRLPEEGFEFVLYLLAKALSLRVFVLHQQPLTNRVIVNDNLDNFFLPIKKDYKRLLTRQLEHNKCENQRLEKIEFYIQEMIKKNRILSKGVNGFGSNLYDLIFCFRKKNEHEVDLKNQYVFFELYYDTDLPDAVLANRCYDQFLAIKFLSESLPKGVILYIKKHYSFYKKEIKGENFKSLYDQINIFNNVRIVKNSYSRSKLIKNALAVAVVTGDIGFEALYERKPVILFGHNWYMYCNGVFNIRNYKELISAIKIIFQDGFKNDYDKFKAYINSLYHNDDILVNIDRFILSGNGAEAPNALDSVEA